MQGEVLEKLVVQIQADMDGLKAAVAQVSASTAAIDRDVQQAGKGIGKSLSGMQAAVSSFVGNWAAMFAQQATAAVQQFVGSTLQAADDIGDLAERLGVGTEAVQRLQAAFVSAGGTPQLMQEAMDKLNMGLGAFVQSGGGPAKEAFESLGLSGKIASGQLRGAENVFYAASEALASIEDPAERARVSMQLFGRNAGVDMVEVTSAGGEALRKYGQAAQDAGRIMSDELVQKTADAKLEIDRTKAALMQMATVGMAQAIVAMQEFGQEIGPKLQPLMDALGPALADLGEAFGPLLEAVMKVGGQFLETFGPTIGAALKGFIEALGVAIRFVTQGLNVVAALLRGDWAGAWQLYLDGVTGIMRSVGTAIQGMVTGALEWMGRLVTDIGGAIMQRFRAAMAAFLAPIQGVQDKFWELWNAVVGNSYIPDMVDGIIANMARLERDGWDPAKAGIASLRTEFAALAIDVVREVDAIADAAERMGITVNRAVVSAGRLRDPNAIVQTVPNIGAGTINTGARGIGDGVPIDPDQFRITDISEDFRRGRVGNPEQWDELTAAQERNASSLGDVMRMGLDFASSIRGGWQGALSYLINNFDKVASVLGRVLGAFGKLGKGGLGGGSGGGGGWLSTLTKTFAGFFAKGGQIGAGKWGVVGERGPELFAPGRTGTVIPMDRMASAGGQSVRLTVPVYVGNQLLYAETQRIALGAAAQAVRVSRAQVPVDSARAQRHQVW